MVNKDKNMEKVLSLDFAEKDLKKKNSASIYVKTCPFCQRKWKLNINLNKGVYRCAACDESGNAIKLHAKIKNISNKAAKVELEGVRQEELKPLVIKDHGDENNLAPLETRSLVYSTLIKNGWLSVATYNDLERRGLPIEECSRYICLPGSDKKFNTSCQLWLENLTNCNLYVDGKVLGVPGIYGELKLGRKNKKENYNSMNISLPFGESGYLIPITTHGKNGNKKISCCQIRHLGEDVKIRYTFFTSDGLKGGCGVGGCNKVHYTNKFWQNGKFIVPKTVNLTEGPLKADVAAYLSNQFFIAVPGVNTTKDLPRELKFLKEGGCETINLCFDMDYRDKKEVKKAMEKVKKMIIDSGLKFKQITWDEKYKGIDDYLLMKKKIKEGK